MKIGFGYRVPQYGSTWEDVIATAQRAEALGFDGLWLNDHFVPDPYSGRYEASTFECWTAAGALAANTTEIRLGFMTLCNAYRLPQIAAKMATSLDVISGGRIDLGIGAGWHEDEFRMYGIPYPSAGVRLDQLEEALEIVHGMFDNEKFSFTGVHYQIDGAWNNPRPIQEPRPPVWIGGAERNGCSASWLATPIGTTWWSRRLTCSNTRWRSSMVTVNESGEIRKRWVVPSTLRSSCVTPRPNSIVT